MRAIQFSSYTRHFSSLWQPRAEITAHGILPRLAGIILLGMSFHGQAQEARDAELLISQGDGSGAPCLTCHGLDGAGNTALLSPRLDILSPEYFVKQLQDFQSGQRSNPLMDSAVDNLSPEEIVNLATHYTSRSASVSPPDNTDISASMIAEGEALALRGDWSSYIVPCNSCHGPDSKGIAPVFPSLAGQHASYIENQLRLWQSGARHNDPQELMKVIALRMNDTQIKAVAAYLSQLEAISP